MYVQQTRHPFDYIIQRVRTGRLALPDFQRDFVWTPSQVVELLDSVSKQWPIGSLLLLTGPQPFAFRAIDSAPDINSTELDLYILDGQQRVTALYHAIMNVSKFCYYVNFTLLVEGEPECIKWERRTRFEKEFPNTTSRANSGVALIQDIWDHSAFFSWLREVRSEDLKEEYVRLREQKLAGLQSRVYQIMAIELEQGIELEALARIFETINRTGVALNAFDLLVAKLYPHNFNLRTAWDQARDQYPIFDRFQPNELEVLKLIALLIRRNKGRSHSRGVRQGDLLSLNPRDIIHYWQEGARRYADALETSSRYGVVTPSLIPSWSMILGLAGCRLDLDKQEMDEWWSNRLALQTFAQAANTKIVSDFDSRMKGVPTAGSELGEADLLDIAERPARPNGLLTRGLIGLMVRNGALDLISGQPLRLSEGLELRWLSPNGDVQKLGAEDNIGGVIALSDSTARRFKKPFNVRQIRVDNVNLLSQGIDLNTLQRDPNFIAMILDTRGVFS